MRLSELKSRFSDFRCNSVLLSIGGVLFLLTFIIFVSYLENLDIVLSGEVDEVKSFACKLILEGFYTKHENLWNHGISADIARYAFKLNICSRKNSDLDICCRKWNDYRCVRKVGHCHILGPVYNLQERHLHSNSFLGLWDSMKCDGIIIIFINTINIITIIIIIIIIIVVVVVVVVVVLFFYCYF